MKNTSFAAKELARRLLDENRHGRPWRKIACEDYGNKVHYAALNKIALHKGEWLPHDRKILQALGLVPERKKADEHTKRIRREVNRMARETKKALEVK